jgi:SM-20-related protein
MTSQLQITYGKPQMFDNLLPQPLFAALVAGMQKIGWQFGWRAPGNPEARYWHHEVGYSEKDNFYDVSARVRQHPLPAFAAYMDWLRSNLVPPETRILRFYLNAHTFGTDGWPHTDTDRNGELTTILFLNSEWRPEWAGETVIFDEKGDILKAVLPQANRLLTFPSHMLHAPRPLSRACTLLRVVLVVKIGPPAG